MASAVSTTPSPSGDKVTRILEAAAEVFATRGFHEARVEEIAALAGVGKGTIYLYFPDKQELFLAMIDNRLKLGMERLKSRSGGTGSAAQRFSAVISEAVAMVTSQPAGAGSEVQPPSSCAAQCRAHLLRAGTQTRELMLQILRDAATEGSLAGGDPDSAATAALWLLQGVAQQYLLVGERPDPGMVARVLAGLLFRPEEPA